MSSLFKEDATGFLVRTNDEFETSRLYQKCFFETLPVGVIIFFAQVRVNLQNRNFLLCLKITSLKNFANACLFGNGEFYGIKLSGDQVYGRRVS